MNNAITKTLAGWVASLFLLSLFACSDVSEINGPENPSSDPAPILLRIPAFNFNTIATVNSIDLYQFSGGSFVKKVTVDPSIDNTVEFSAKPLTRIYALAGIAIGGKQEEVEEVFSSLTVPMPKDSYSAPVFFSSVTHFPDRTGVVNIELQRAVSRLDIENADPDLKIEKVCIEGAASSSHIFSNDGWKCESASASYTRFYEAGIEGLAERAFILFETTAPITVTVSGRRFGEAVEITTQTPPIARNSIYTVSIGKSGTGNSKERSFSDGDDCPDEEEFPKATIKVKDWQEGDMKSGSLSLGETAIDRNRSFLPAGVRVNSADNTVTVSPDGAKGIMLAFSTKAPLSLGSVLSDTEGVSVAPAGSSASDEGYVSEFRIDVAKQPKCGAHYQTTVFFNGSSSFFINIEVEPSPYQIPTVRIGGHDWMCFNAVSSDPEEQIFLPQGKSVEKKYIEGFTECLGNHFQYGRPHPFSPWNAYDPDVLADEPRDIPWVTRSKIPLPKGYHVPSKAEWHDLIPDGTVIPSTYTTPSGETIRASIVTLPGTLDDTPSAATNAQNYMKRCVVFESLSTGARLFLPVAGIKTNISIEIPTHPSFRFDSRSGYWMKEDQTAMLLTCQRQGDGSEGIQFKRNRWEADGFVMLRGIRD